MVPLLIFVGLFSSAIGTEMHCPPNACDKIYCAPLNCPNGLIDQHAGFCHCCPFCVSVIAYNNSCLHTFLYGLPRCEHGTTCDPQTVTCRLPAEIGRRSVVRRRSFLRLTDAETCAEKKARIDASLLAAQQMGQPLLGLESPNCDVNGDYAPVQFAGSMAFCVFKNGTRIPGFSSPRWQADEKNCQCAVDLYAYKASGLIRDMFYCDTQGNYAAVQCLNSRCYCVDKHGRRVGSLSVHPVEISRLNC